MKLHRLGEQTLDDGAAERASGWYELALRLERRPADATKLEHLWTALLAKLERLDKLAAHLEARVRALDEAEQRAAMTARSGKARLDDLRDRLVRACDRFIEAFPTDEDAPRIALRAAAASLARGNQQDARTRLEALLRRWPAGDHAEPARELLQQATTPASGGSP